MATDSIAQVIVNTALAGGVDPRLAVEVAYQESGLSQDARGAAGEVGVFQLRPDTARQLGVDAYDLGQNIVGGVRYLAMQLSRFGDPAAALAAYNWGPGRVSDAIGRWGASWLDHAPSSTQSYVSRILGNVATQYDTEFAPAAAVSDAANGAVELLDSFNWTALGYAVAIGLAALLAFRMLKEHYA